MHLRRADPKDVDAAGRLFRLTSHPHDESAEFAFTALLADPDLRVTWIAAKLALETSCSYRPTFNGDNVRDFSVQQLAEKKALEDALRALVSAVIVPFSPLPGAWSGPPSITEFDEDESGRHEPDPMFDVRHAHKHLRSFPIEKWCGSDQYKPFALDLLRMLANWTSARLTPQGEGNGRHDTGYLAEWLDAFGDLVARAAPSLDKSIVKQELLEPFYAGRKGLDFIAVFADRTMVRHVLDARVIPPDTIDLLSVCVDRLLEHPMFDPKSYRAGEVSGGALPRLIDAILVVAVERADGAARFVNGDWREIGLVMSMVTRLVEAGGWSTYVMSKYLILCERVGASYPLDDFVKQVGTSITNIDKAKRAWVGTTLPARIAAIVQRLADANFPLRPNQSQGLLRILDALIDLGDRRSAALEQTEAFKSVQVASV